MLRQYMVLLTLVCAAACRDVEPQVASAAESDTTVTIRAPIQVDPTANLLGRVPVLEYHLFGDSDKRWQRSRDSFRKDLETPYERGYRPVSISDLVDSNIILTAGRSPVVFTFDDASPSQFRLIEEEDAILQVAGGVSPSPHDSLFNALRIPRFQVFGTELTTLLDHLDRNGNRLISDGRSRSR